MKKIPTIFIRDRQTHMVTDEVNPECLWVFQGQGVATRKYDGTCCLIEDGKLYKRREIKPGNPLPDGFQYVEADEVTARIIGWVPVSDTDPADRWHREAFEISPYQEDGTYELCGPKINGNPEWFKEHRLVPHRLADRYHYCPRSFTELKAWLTKCDIEGVVFHHPDGRMAKIKLRDFGLRRSTKER